MIEWDEKYSTGVEEIDHQHKWIFDFVNTLEHDLNDHETKLDIEHILKSMKEYAAMHFHYEEGCMTKWKCPVAKENKCAHDNFVFAYENFMERYLREGHSEELAWKIHDMVEGWIVSHICKIDIHLRKCQKVAHESK